jgi:hypothetical protein
MGRLVRLVLKFVMHSDINVLTCGRVVARHVSCSYGDDCLVGCGAVSLVVVCRRFGGCYYLFL